MKFYLLTKDFYETYFNCPEILKKENRPYVICLIEVDDLTFAIPIRHNITHKYSIKTFNNQGLDFTKAVIINKKTYISEKNVYIENEEFQILFQKKNLIKPKLIQFIKIYKKAVINNQDNKNKLLCAMSSLQYFHKELGIE